MPRPGAVFVIPCVLVAPGVPGVFGRKFTVNPSAVVFADFPSPDDQKWCQKSALFPTVTSSSSSRAGADHLAFLFDQQNE